MREKYFKFSKSLRLKKTRHVFLSVPLFLLHAFGYAHGVTVQTARPLQEQHICNSVYLGGSMEVPIVVEDQLSLHILDASKNLDPVAFPNLRETSQSFLSIKNERGILEWKNLSERQKDDAIERSFESKLRFGKVRAGEAPEEIALSRKNAIDAYRKVREWSQLPLGDEAQLADRIQKLNSEITKALPPHADRPKSKNFSDFIKELHAKLSQKESDPIEVAAWAYLKLSKELIPFAEGNTRTAHFLVDYILLRSGFPPPTFVGGTGMASSANPLAGWHDYAESSAEKFRDYLNYCVKDTVRTSLMSVAEVGPPFVPEGVKIVRSLGEGKKGIAMLAEYKNGWVVYKYSKNAAGFGELRREVEVLRLIQNHKVFREAFGPPQILMSHPNGDYVVKEYRDGIPGMTLVEQHSSLSEKQMMELKKISKAAADLRAQTGVQLDLLPENMLWNEEAGRWTLIDYGTTPIPLRYDDFETYFSSHWKKPL